MSDINTGGPAFPRTVQRWNDSLENVEGMTLRDWYAGKAMPVLLTELFAGWRGHESPCVPEWMDGVSADAYRMADSMIRTRDCVAAPKVNADMLTALREVLKTAPLQSSLQVLCAAAIARATGQDVAQVIESI